MPDKPWSDDTTPLADVKARLRRFNADRDWGQYHSPRNLAMALSVETAELLDLFLWCSDEGPQPAVATRMPRVEQEAADVAICLLNFCELAGIDLCAAVERKIARNEAAYPVEKARGRMEKYTEV